MLLALWLSFLGLLMSFIFGIVLCLRLSVELDDEFPTKFYVGFMITRSGMTCYELLEGSSKLIAVAMILSSALYTYWFCKKTIAYQKDEDYLFYAKYDERKILLFWRLTHIGLLIYGIFKSVYGMLA